jgi:hypothetical protein
MPTLNNFLEVYLMKLIAQITEATVHPGGFVALVFEAAGRRIYGEAKICDRAFSALCHAVGIAQITDSSQLIGKTAECAVAEVKVPGTREVLVATAWAKANA